MPPSVLPCCVYGNPCFSVCINAKCKKFGMVCQKGYETKQQCFLFHQQCQQIKWSQLQKMATQNVYTSTPQFLQFRLKIERLFIKAIEKIKEQQQKFKIWVKTFGHSIEVMNDQSYQEISGSLVAPVINSFFKDENNISRPPNIVEEDIRQIQLEIQNSIDNITSLYLRTAKRKPKQQYSMVHIPSSSSTSQFFQDKQKMLSRSQRYQKFEGAPPYPEVRQRNQSQIHSSQRSAEGSKYNQRRERLQGSIISSDNDQLNKSRHEIRHHEMMVKFNSKIYRYIENIKKLFTHAKPIGFKLLYRASQHEFSIEQFHKLCDNIPNTLVLIQTQFSKIIGGFSALEWKSNKKQWVADKKKESFMFSLSLNQKYQLNLPQFAISCNGQKGPIFGCCDISICDKSNKEKSSAQFPISYNIDKKYHRGDQASFAFTGHPKGQYKTKEWEVFKVEFQ